MKWRGLLAWLRRKLCRRHADEIAWQIAAPTLLMLCFFAGSNVLKAEPDTQSQVLSFHRWGLEDGLPDETVTALLQTQDGYLWVGMATGLARFDGVEFDSVRLPANNSNQAAAVTSLCEDDSHRLWVGTREHGLFWVAHGVVHPFANETATNQSITSLAADAGGQLWVGTTAGFFRVNLATLKRAAPSLGFTNDLISSVHAARSGTIWITTRQRDESIQKWRHHPGGAGRRKPRAARLEFMGLYEDRTGSLWAFGDTYLVNLSEGKRFNYFRTGDASSFRIWTLVRKQQRPIVDRHQRTGPVRLFRGKISAPGLARKPSAERRAGDLRRPSGRSLAWNFWRRTDPPARKTRTSFRLAVRLAGGNGVLHRC